MVLKRVTSSLKLSWSIYDSWAELLVGTRFLLDVIESQVCDKIEKVNLLRLVIISSSQMTETMLFTQMQKFIDAQSDIVRNLFKYDMSKRISFSEAGEKWPKILTGKNLDFSSEPMQSMKSLSKHRNAAIHHSAKYPPIGIGESAFYTAVDSSKYIYDHFNGDSWDSSEYKKFVDDNKPKSQILLCKALSE
nr:hypothetical protein [Desulfobacula sp.]